MDTNIFSLKMMYKFAIICLQIFGSVKCGDRTLMGRSRPNFSPKLEPIGPSLCVERFWGTHLCFRKSISACVLQKTTSDDG